MRVAMVFRAYVSARVCGGTKVREGACISVSMYIYMYVFTLRMTCYPGKALKQWVMGNGQWAAHIYKYISYTRRDSETGGSYSVGQMRCGTTYERRHHL